MAITNFYPLVSELIQLDKMPDKLVIIKSVVNNILEDLAYKNLFFAEAYVNTFKASIPIMENGYKNGLIELDKLFTIKEQIPKLKGNRLLKNGLVVYPNV